MHPQAIQDIEEFVSSSASVAQQWMLCSEWVPSEWESMDALQWMGAVRMRVNGCSAVNGCRQNESQWMLCSEWVPSEWESMDALQWMGAVRVQTADKDITILHTTPVHQLTSGEDKSSVLCICKKQIHPLGHFNIKLLLPAKVHNP